MLTEPTILIVLAVVAIYTLMSRWIELSIITLPMIFTGLGLALGGIGLDLVPMNVGNEVVHSIAEITLVLVLFSDASGVKRKTLSGANVTIPLRMLLIGMPLTIVLGTLVARWVSPEQPWALALLVAPILTPTEQICRRQPLLDQAQELSRRPMFSVVARAHEVAVRHEHVQLQVQETTPLARQPPLQ